MYRRNYPNDPGFADSIAAAQRASSRQQQRQRWHSWARVRGRLPGCVLGAALLLAGCCLGFWNEARAVARDRVLYEGLERVTSLPAAQYHSADNEGHLVHLSGELSVSGWCHDPEFGLRLRAYRMHRTVELYQWVEEQTEHQGDQSSEGGSRAESTPEYHTAWLPYLVNSAGFEEPSRHRNPPAMPHAELDFTADGASLGVYQLTDALLAHIRPDDKAVDAASAAASAIHSMPLDELAKRGYVWRDGFLYTAGSGGSVGQQPQVGDARLRWSYGGLAGQPVTVIGRQAGQSLAAYSVGDGEEIALLAEGYRSPRQMFGAELARSRLQLWALRVAAWLLLFLACLAGSPALEVALGRVRPLRPLLALPLASQCLCVSGSLSLLVTGLAWLRHRPPMGLALLALCLAPPLLARLRRRRGVVMGA